MQHKTTSKCMFVQIELDKKAVVNLLLFQVGVLSL